MKNNSKRRKCKKNLKSRCLQQIRPKLKSKSKLMIMAH